MIENRTVLLLDTDPFSRGAIRTVLLGCGFAVFEARDAREAATLLENSSHYIDVALVAVGFGDESTIAFVEHELSSRRDLAIVYMTALSNAAIVGYQCRHTIIEMPNGIHALDKTIRQTLDAVARTASGSGRHLPHRPPNAIVD